MTVCN